MQYTYAYILYSNLNCIFYITITYLIICNPHLQPMPNFLGVLAILFFLAFCVKVCLNAFASNVQSTASIVQYSVLTLCLLIPFGQILSKWLSSSNNDNIKNANTAFFLVGIAWVLGNVLAFIALNGRDIDMLNLGRLKPSINSAINVYWIIIPQFILIFYNWKLLMDCSPINTCSSKVTWITLIILAFALIQTYLIVDSSRVIEYWPTDDGRRNIPRIQL